MTLQRLREIKDRLNYARNGNPRGVLPEMGDLRAMEELVEEVEHLWITVMTYERSIDG